MLDAGFPQADATGDGWENLEELGRMKIAEKRAEMEKE